MLVVSVLLELIVQLELVTLSIQVKVSQIVSSLAQSLVIMRTLVLALLILNVPLDSATKVLANLNVLTKDKYLEAIQMDVSVQQGLNALLKLAILLQVHASLIAIPQL
jgi:hypothetical protein